MISILRGGNIVLVKRNITALFFHQMLVNYNKLYLLNGHVQ